MPIIIRKRVRQEEVVPVLPAAPRSPDPAPIQDVPRGASGMPLPRTCRWCKRHYLRPCDDEQARSTCWNWLHLEARRLKRQPEPGTKEYADMTNEQDRIEREKAAEEKEE